MSRKIIGRSSNGNYEILLFSDGTKIRFNNEATMKADFPESIDVKITNSCTKGCEFCHEKSVPNGKHANLSHPLFNSLHPYTELALGGGNVLEHPFLNSFLTRMKNQKVICNMTVHLDHFLDKYWDIRAFQEESKIHGVGISVNKAIDQDIIDKIKSVPNTVVHTIAGVMPQEGYETLYDNNIKLLILGYKTYGRGIKYFEHNDIMDKISDLRANLVDMFQHFNLISFDNLALKQLEVQEIISPEVWEKCYMGDDGDYTMYLDMVEEKFSKSSVSERVDINSNRIEDLFNQVRRK